MSEITMQARVTDNDNDEITVALEGKELRGWSYANDAERRQKMVQAREYVEGWCDGKDVNARLIAQMLAALKATRIYVETLEKHLNPVADPGASTIREHGAMLRAAIAKAEAQTSGGGGG